MKKISVDNRGAGGDTGARGTDRLGAGVRELNLGSKGCLVRGLCGKRILIVGGLDRLKSSYCSLVEEQGGVCEHHCGCVRGGHRRLAASLKRADLVLCLADCNSHAACMTVKNLGKRLGKPVRMLGSSSLNSVSEALKASPS